MAKDYYWIIAPLDNQIHLMPGGYTEDEARQSAFEQGLITFDIKMLPTTDENTATRMYKYGVLKSTKDLRKATKRVKHKINKNRR